MVQHAVILALLVARGAAAGPAPAARPAPPEAADGSCMAGTAGGEQVTLRGVARDAKAGAVLVADDGRVLYLAGLDAWPAQARGKRVEVSGALASEKYIPDPGTAPLTAGAQGQQLVLRGAAWRLLE